MLITNERLNYLLANDFTSRELNGLNDEEFLIALWKTKGIAIVEYVNSKNWSKMTMKEFLSHCTSCGGDWGAMFLLGIKDIDNAIYLLIPDDMGVYAYRCLMCVLSLINVETD